MQTVLRLKEVAAKYHEIIAILISLIILYHYPLKGLIVHNDFYQWDFRERYYNCTKAWSEGINPYDAQKIWQRFPLRDKAYWWYAYSPVSLFLFKPFLIFEYNRAYYLYLFFKLVALVFLIALWRNYFFERKTDIIFYLLCVLAFNSTIRMDLASGNIALFEQLLIWIAFIFFLKDKMVMFCFFVLLSSIIKAQTIFFIFMLFFSSREKKYYYMISSFIIFASLLMVQYVAQPVLFEGFVQRMNKTFKYYERGIINPAIMPFIRDSLEPLTGLIKTSWSNECAICVYAGFSLTVMALSIRAIKRLKALCRERRMKFVTVIACIVYTLINPQMKDYNYMIMIVPVYFLLKNAVNGNILDNIIFTMTGIILSASIMNPWKIHAMLSVNRNSFVLFWDYFPLMMALAVWFLYLLEIDGMKSEDIIQVRTDVVAP